MSARLCEYAIVRLAPDPIRDEAVNIGVVLREVEGEYSGARVTPDFRRVQCLFPGFETAHLAGLQQSLEAALRRDPRQLAYQVEETFSQSLRVSGFHGLTTPDPAAAMSDLYRRFVATRPAGERPRVAARLRARILAELHRRFETALLLARMNFRQAVRDLGLGADSFRFDFHYATGGGHHVIQAIDLGGEAARIKELCFTVQSLRARHRSLAAEAVYEVREAPESGLPGVQFRLSAWGQARWAELPQSGQRPPNPEEEQRAFLREAGIELVPLAQSDDLIARVARELRVQ